MTTLTTNQADTNYPMLVACINASGQSDVFTTDFKQSEVDPVDHAHIEKAIELAEEAGYGGPFVVFEPHEFDYMRAALKAAESNSVTTGH